MTAENLSPVPESIGQHYRLNSQAIMLAVVRSPLASDPSQLRLPNPRPRLSHSPPAEKKYQSAINSVLASVTPSSKGELCYKKSEYFLEIEGDVSAEVKRQKVAIAKALCARCPVVKSCLEQALLNENDEGIRGGKTARERVNIRKKRLAG